MNKKIEDKIRNIVTKTTMKANKGRLRLQTINKIIDGYMKFLNVAFKISTGIAFGFCFIYLLPVRFGMSWDRIMVIMLLLIFFQLRFGKKT